MMGPVIRQVQRPVQPEIEGSHEPPRWRTWAARAAGRVLAVVMRGSFIALPLPFAGTLAWTALVLAAAARLVRAATWPRAILWAVLVALAWGQVAGAHLAHGLAIATFTVIAYLAYRLVADVRAGVRTGRKALALAGLVLVAL